MEMLPGNRPKMTQGREGKTQTCITCCPGCRSPEWRTNEDFDDEADDDHDDDDDGDDDGDDDDDDGDDDDDDDDDGDDDAGDDADADAGDEGDKGDDKDDCEPRWLWWWWWWFIGAFGSRCSRIYMRTCLPWRVLGAARAMWKQRSVNWVA